MTEPACACTLWIDGQAVDGLAPPLPSINPASGQVNHQTASASAEQVDAAVAAAARAAAAPAWRDRLPHLRAALLHRVAALMDAHAAEFARLQRTENGKVQAECDAQVRSAAATFRYYAAVCETQGSEVTPARGAYLSMTAYEPYGVVAALTPWNSPMTMDAQKVAPALAAGNAVVLKPSEVTPSPARLLGELVSQAATEAGLPAGLLNVLMGPGSIVGRALVEHPGVGMVSFTGGTATGRRIAAAAAERLKPVALELGGKSPHIVCADADLDAAADAVAGGIFEGSGQSCVAGSRVFIERPVWDAVLQRLVQRAEALKLAPPDAPGAQMGPIASFGHRDRIIGLVRQAVDDGAQVLTGGDIPQGAGLSDGAWYAPTVLAGMAPEARIAQEEIFGPVLCALPFDGDDDLIAQANGTAYGLAAGIWSADYRRALRLTRALQAGTVWINTYKQLSISTPFGGYKDSGLGREKGIAGMRLYQQCKSVYLGL